VLFLMYWIFNAYDTYGLFEIKYFWPVFPIYVGSCLMLLPYTVLLADLLDNRFFKFTAKISFGLYLWHFLVMKVLNIILYPQYKPFSSFDNSEYFTATAIMLVVSYGVASASFYLLEQPFIRYSKIISQ